MLTKKSILVIILICLSLTVIWFGRGMQIAATESGIPFYSVKNVLELYSTTWSQILLGIGVGRAYISIPFFWFTGLIEKTGLPGYINQSIVVFLLLLASAVFTYIWVKEEVKRELTDQKSLNITALFAALFYVLNFIAIASVWNRMQYPFIIFYCLLPMVIYLYSRCFRGFNIINVGIFAIVTQLCVFAYSSPPTLLLFWIVIVIYTFFQVAKDFINNQTFIKPLLVLGATMISWLLINVWWIIQFVKVLQTSANLTESAYSLSGNIFTFIVLSERKGNLSYIFRMLDREFIDQLGLLWGNIFSQPVYILLSYLIPFFAFYPLLVIKKPKVLNYFIGISLLILFAMKGSVRPFGYISLFLFSNFRPFESFRAAFEKFGLILPLFYAPLIGFSVSHIYNMISLQHRIKKLKNAYLLTAAIIILGFLVYPMWNRWVFSNMFAVTKNLNIGYYTQVPDYYQNISRVLDKDQDLFRIATLPIGDEGITYKWSYGYDGIEYSNGLFSKPVISQNTSFEFLPHVVNQIESILMLKPQYFTQYLSVLNAKYLVIRKDIDFNYRSMTNPELLASYVASSSGTIIPSLKYSGTFGPLILYENTQFSPKIYITDKIVRAPLDSEYADVAEISGLQNGDAILNSVNSKSPDLGQLKSELLYPDNEFDYSKLPPITLEEALRYSPYIRYYPWSKAYPLIRLKEKLQFYLEKDDGKKYFDYLTNTEKRMSELLTVIESRPDNETDQAISQFKTSIHNFRDYINAGHSAILKKNIENTRYRIRADIVLLNNKLSGINDDSRKLKILAVKDFLVNFAKEIGVFSIYDPYQNFNNNEILFQYTIPENGKYELWIRKPGINFSGTESDKTVYQLNDSLVDPGINTSEGWNNLGKIDLIKGKNEIGIPIYKSSNLINDSDENIAFELNSIANNRKEFPINNFSQFNNYILKFEYKVSEQNLINIKLVNDNTDIVNGSAVWSFNMSQDEIQGWKSRALKYTSPKGATSAKIIFTLLDANCLRNKKSGPDDACISKSTDGINNGLLRDVRFEQLYEPDVVLKRDFISGTYTASKPELTFKKVNNARYTVHVENTIAPYLLVFSESYHPLWTIRFADTNQEISGENHLLINSFGNGWKINRTGEYDMIIEFAAENQARLGSAISYIAVILWIISVLIYKYIRYRKHE